MTWFGYVYVAVAVIGTCLSIGTIGQPRDPLKPSTAVGVLIVNALLVAGAVSVGTTHT